MNPEVVTQIISELEKRFSETMPLLISRGLVHKYLGMMFDFSKMGECKILMFQYLSGVIKHAGEVYKQGAGGATPAPNHLYDMRN